MGLISFAGDEIVGEVTLIMSNFELNGLRVNKQYEGRGIAGEEVFALYYRKRLS